MKLKTKRYLRNYFTMGVNNGDVTLIAKYRPVGIYRIGWGEKRLKTIHFDPASKEYKQFSFFEQPGYDQVVDKFYSAIRTFKANDFSLSYKKRKPKNGNLYCI